VSKDGQPVVFHDYSLERLTKEKGAVAQTDLADLQRLTLLGSGETIPSLEQVFSLVNGRVPLLIEFKDQDGIMGPNTGPLDQAVADLLPHYHGPVAIMSYNPHAMAHMAQIAPNTPRGLVTSGFPEEDWPTIPNARLAELRHIPDFARVDAAFISHGAEHLGMPRVTELKNSGTPVICWTVRSPAEETAARKIADNITFEGYLPNFQRH